MNEYETLQKLCNDAEALARKGVRSSSPDFKAWKTRASRFLIKHYGEDSYEYNNFKKISYSLSVCTFDTPDSSFVRACSRGLQQAQAILETYFDDFEEKNNSEPMLEMNLGDFSKVFVVHGHDGELRERVARIIERQGLKAIILNEQANAGLTIIEKLEAESDAAGAVCLFTDDDVGRNDRSDEERPRARQNVVFETGYFIGRLGRGNVAILANREVELPSDMQGIVYVNTDAWEFALLKELKKMGYSIDMNLLDA